MHQVEIPDMPFEKLRTWKQLENVTWSEMFENMALNLTVIEQYLKNIDDGVAINDNTMFTFYDMWINNFADNFKYFKDSKPFESLMVRDGSALILGAGPSLEGKWDLVKQFKGDIFCCDILLKECLEHNIIPTYVTAIDGLPRVADYFRSEVVQKHIGDIKAILATMVDVEVTELVKNRYFIHPQIDQPERANPPSVTRFMLSLNKVYDTPIPTCSVLGNVGMASWLYANLLNYSEIVLLGIDLGFKSHDGKIDLNDSPTFAGMRKKQLDGEMSEVEVLSCFREKVNKFGNLVFTDMIKGTYVNTAEGFIGRKVLNKTIQCGEWAFVDNCKCMLFEDYIKRQL